MRRHDRRYWHATILLIVALGWTLGCVRKPPATKPPDKDELTAEIRERLEERLEAAERFREARPPILSRVEAPEPLAPPGAKEPDFCGNRRTVTARIVALDQPLFINRSGATIPAGAIYALAGDVVDSNTGASCYPADPATNPGLNPACQPGTVQLRPYKRPRPMVLRADEGDCLKIHFTNLLSMSDQVDFQPPAGPESTFPQPPTRAVSLHIQGMNWADGPQDDGSWVGGNCNSQVAPDGSQPDACAVSSGNSTTYTLFADHEGSYLIYSRGDDYTKLPAAAQRNTQFGSVKGVSAGGGDGGFLQLGLFGSLNVQPSGFEETEEYFEDQGFEGAKLWHSEYYRSQVTEQDLCYASQGHTVSGGKCSWADPSKLPTIDYQAVYPPGHPRAGFPILNMLCPAGSTVCQENEIVHSDLTAIITGPGAGRFPDNFQPQEQPPALRPAYSYPNRLQPFREFTIVYHETYQVAQAFQYYFDQLPALNAAQDNFAINYGMGGLAPPVLANRLGVGSATDCVECKYEEFFLTSWALGDPAMIVDNPAETCLESDGTPRPGCRATVAYFPDDPSNVYHSYMSDHLKFRILHAGPDLHHLHHQHAHQWIGSPNSPNGDYLDSQSIGPGSSFTLEMVYEGSGNLNQTVGDSIFHCHFYPHFASGMWSLWRVHDVFEAGTRLDSSYRPLTYCLEGYDRQPYEVEGDLLVCPRGYELVTEARALPDGELMAGAPTPAVVPMPTLPMAPVPAPVRLVGGGKNVEVQVGDQWVSTLEPTSLTWEQAGAYKNPGYPFFIAGIGGRRAPHPPMDFAWVYSGCTDPSNNGAVCTPPQFVSSATDLTHVEPPPPGCQCDTPLDGGLPRHVMNGPKAENEDEYLLKECPGLKGNPPQPGCMNANQAQALLPYARTDFSKEISRSPALKLPEDGTYVEKIAMAAHAQRFHFDSQLPDGRQTGICSRVLAAPDGPDCFPVAGGFQCENLAPCWGDDPQGRAQCANPFTATCDPKGQINFVLNGLHPAPGAPYADPCIQFDRDGGPAPGGIEREYLAVDIQLDAIFNKEGWHFPQQRMISLWGDAVDFITKQKPPEPLFMRVNSYDCMNYTLANLVPNVYELDDFQVRTPTDILGQHIHLVKFDVTSSDGSANGFNYEDGTFAPNEVTERIRGINEAGGLSVSGESEVLETLTPKTIPFFGQGPGGTGPHNNGAWLGAQATIQRWYDDPLYNNLGFCETDLSKRCTLAENSPSSPFHCPAPPGSPPDQHGMCIPSAGFCSNDPSQRCTEFDLSNCAPDAECNPLHDRTIRTVFTHDHFGPSTHQQAGLYAGVVAEPKDSVWWMNQRFSAQECQDLGGVPDGGNCIMGGWNAATMEPYPGRSVTQNGVTLNDSGPTSWEAVIVPPIPPDGKSPSYREFLFQFQDSTLMYEPFYTWEFNPDVWSLTGRAQYADGDLGVCDSEEGENEPCGFCSYTGRCSIETDVKCLVPPPGGTAPAAGQGGCADFTLPDGTKQAQQCVLGTGLLTACTTTHKDDCISYRANFVPHAVDSCNYVAGIPSTTWNAGQEFSPPPSDPEGVTFDGATSNFSYNYRNEPLFPRINDLATGTLSSGEAGDLAWVYSSSVTRPNPRGKRCAGLLGKTCTQDSDCGAGEGPCMEVGFCSGNYAMCTDSEAGKIYCPPGPPYPTCNFDPPYSATPLTPGVYPGDPFTPLMRAYASDDIQIRTLAGAHINPHNITMHGLNWLKEPSFVDSGWRNSEVSGISEHFEILTQLDAPYSPAPADYPFTDYLWIPGMAALELSSGNWGLLRAYTTEQGDLPQLPQNEIADVSTIEVCPSGLPACGDGVREPCVRSYEVVALTAQQALADPLVYSKAPGPAIEDPDAMLFFRTDDPDLHCTDPGGGQPWTCSAAYSGEVEPLVLRAAAGDCIEVKLYNGINPKSVAAKGAGSTPNAGSSLAPSQVSTEVGLHPQLVTYDVRQSDGTNVGFNPQQTVKPGGDPVTYTWYAGHVEPDPPPDKPRYIPIEFGGSNLLPPDPLNHYRHGLFGGLVIEPEGSRWTAPDGNAFAGVEAIVYYTEPDEKVETTFREFVLFMQDDLSNLPPPNNGPKPVDAANYRSPYLGNPSSRYCDASCSKDDVSCVLSDQAFCWNSGGTCTPCDPDPVFAACAGEEVRFRLLHPGGANTNEVFELFGHTFSEAPYVTAEEHCQPPTTHTNLYASQMLGQVNLCGSSEFWLDPKEYIEGRVLRFSEGRTPGTDPPSFEAILQRIDQTPALSSLLERVREDYIDFTEGAVWEASLNEWKASRMGHGPGNHFDVLVEHAGGANAVSGDYLWRSYPAMHFNRGIWGIFRVVDPDAPEGLTCHLPPQTASAPRPAAAPVTAGAGME